ncbi:MAG: N-acetylmuramoyl-L-alanine amidase [Cyclobacteriaceae bacterium]
MIKKIGWWVAGLLMITLGLGNASAQYTQLSGVKICLDPGHGGHDSNDRPTDLGVGTTYYESDANWEAVGYLDSLLQKLGADVKITKTTNDPDAEDREPSLSDRVQVANTFGADYFHSFHTNGSDNKSVNYTLILYAGPEDGTADYPDALAMAEIQEVELFEYMRTTTHYARADIPFTGYTNGLGVLNNLSMPGTLSECSFHSNIDEGRRLMNSGYRKAAAWGLVKSFLEYYEAGDLDVGEIGGLVTDTDGNALNGITVTINPDEANEKIYTGDQYLNGYYLFDWLQPGEYSVKYEKFGYDAQVKTVTVTAGGYTEVDAALNPAGGAPSTPELLLIESLGEGDGVSATWVANSETTLLGYRLYYATDDSMENWALAADESTLTAASTSVSIASKDGFIVTPSSDVYHFKLTAVAESGAESEAGDIYARSAGVEGDKVLIVDGFDRTSGSYTENTHSFASHYFVAIRDSRLAEVSSASNDAVWKDSVDLADYDMVVWFVGDESTADETFSDEEQTRVKAYLENGGKLFVSGSELGWDLDSRGTATDQAFCADYLKTEYVGDGAVDYTPATGVSGTAFAGLTIPFGITYPEDYPDDIAPVGEAQSIFDYAVEGKRGGVAYKGTFGDGTAEGGVVVISFTLETAERQGQNLTIRKVMDYLEVGEYFANPPSQPVLLQVEGAGSGVSASWEPGEELSLIGYRLYYAKNEEMTEWGLVANEQTLNRSDSSVFVDDFANFLNPADEQAQYFKLTAISEGGFESAASDVYAADLNTADINILLVDGFDRTNGSYTETSHDFATSYHKALAAAGNSNVVTVANEQVEQGNIDLSDYYSVFWILGDETSSGTTFSVEEQAAVADYLEQGGSLFVSGSEIGWDLYNRGDDADKAFYQNYLKANFVGDGGSGQSPATGVAGTDFSDLEIAFGITYPEDYPDIISAASGAEEILNYTTGGAAGVAYTGIFSDSEIPGSLVYLSFPLETANQTDIDETLAAVADYFGIFSGVAPFALADFASTTSDTGILIDVLANDWDKNDNLDPATIMIVQQPTNGTVTVQDEQIFYQPERVFGGEDTFTYQVSDNSGLTSEEALVTISVENVPLSVSDNHLEFQIFPNPVKDGQECLLSIGIPADEDVSIKVLNLEGKVLVEQRHELVAGHHKVAVSTEQLPQGLYLVLISTTDETKATRLIKE